MDEEWQTESEGSSLKTIAVVLIVIVSIIAVTGLTLTADWEEQIHPTREYTTYYSAVTPQEAKEINNETANIVIVDIRGCDCDYKEGHLEFAVWNTYAPSYYNTAHDILIYDDNGTDCIAYCKMLIDHVYGDLYYLDGGITAWKEAGFKTIAVTKSN